MHNAMLIKNQCMSAIVAELLEQQTEKWPIMRCLAEPVSNP